MIPQIPKGFHLSLFLFAMSIPPPRIHNDPSKRRPTQVGIKRDLSWRALKALQRRRETELYEGRL